jgi:hypothetical protein
MGKFHKPSDAEYSTRVFFYNYTFESHSNPCLQRDLVPCSTGDAQCRQADYAVWWTSPFMLHQLTLKIFILHIYPRRNYFHGVIMSIFIP